VINDVVPVIPQDTLKAWIQKLKFESIFDGVHTDDENYVTGGHDKRRYQSLKVKAKKILPELKIDELKLFLMALGFEDLDEFKVLKSPGFPEPVHQAPHRDHGTPDDFFHNSGAVNGCVCSVIASLMGMELDIWRTAEGYRLRKEEGPRHGSPSSVPLLTIRLPPGAIIIFRFDLWHAGRGYISENYRLFMTCIPARGSSKVDPRTEETFFNRCTCHQAVYEKAAIKHTSASRFLKYDKKSKDYVFPACKCEPRKSSGKSYEEWLREETTRPDSVINLQGENVIQRGRKRASGV